MESKFTPGPWVADIRMGVFAVYPESEERGGCLAERVKNEVVRQGGIGDPAYEGGYRLLTEEQEANARLISAAPELLEACEMMAGVVETDAPDYIERGGPACAAYDALCAAIAKAKGEA